MLSKFPMCGMHFSHRGLYVLFHSASESYPVCRGAWAWLAAAMLDWLWTYLATSIILRIYSANYYRWTDYKTTVRITVKKYKWLDNTSMQRRAWLPQCSSYTTRTAYIHTCPVHLLLLAYPSDRPQSMQGCEQAGGSKMQAHTSPS